MTMAAEWLSAKIVSLSEINDDEAKLQLLGDIKMKLRNMETHEIKDIANTFDLTGLFAQLTSENRHSVEETCNALQIIFSNLEPGEIHLRYNAEITRFLNHRASAVKSLVLSELSREVSSPEKWSNLSNDLNLLTLIVEKIGDEELNVAKLAMDITKKIGSHRDGVKILYSGILLRTIAKLLVKNDIVSFRIYNIVVWIAKTSEESLEASATSGFLESLINVLDYEDVLLQLNALELLTDLALEQHGLDYLEEREVLQKLSDKITRVDEDPLSNLVVPGLMKFFGSVARSRPNEIFSKYPAVVSALFEVIEAEDFTLLGNALDTLGLVAMSVEGKYALQLRRSAMSGALKKIAEIIEKMPNELRLRGLENLGFILRVEKKDQDDKIVALTKSWFDCLADDSIGLLVRISKQPFPDLRQASLEVLNTISIQNWGQEYIANCPGLVEFLLDRNVEGFKNCKDLKYLIVKNLCDADNDILDSGTVQNLKKFIREGPFYVDVEMEVTTEGAS